MWTPSISPDIALWTAYTKPFTSTTGGEEMQIQPYLFFNGRCEEAADFYRRTIGAEQIMLMRWKDCPEPKQPGMVPPGSEDKVMHMALRIGETTVLASDGPCQGQQNFQGFALSLTVANEAEADRKFAALAAPQDLNDLKKPVGGPHEP